LAGPKASSSRKSYLVEKIYKGRLIEFDTRKRVKSGTSGISGRTG
jgi:hypothetical protein